MTERPASAACAAIHPSPCRRKLLTLLAILLLVAARLVAASTLPDQTWVRTTAYTDNSDNDELIRLVWSHSPSALPAVTVVVTCTSVERVDVTAVLTHAPIAVPASCSRAPPAALA